MLEKREYRDISGDPHRRAWLEFCLQLVFCYPLVMLVVAPVAALLGRFGLSGDLPSHIHFAGYEALLCLLIGPVIGWQVGSFAPWLVASGKWLWVLPTFVLGYAVCNAARSQLVPWLPEEFFASPSNERIAVYFLTLPSCSAVGYSIGMASQCAWQFKPRWDGILGGLVSMAIGSVLFFASVGLVHRFECAKWESWSKLRFIIDPSGLRFASDPGALCADSNAGRFPLIIAHVESLETRICNGGQILGASDPRARDGIPIDKVRVLDGPRAGAIGWVLSYGLRGTTPPDISSERH